MTKIKSYSPKFSKEKPLKVITKDKISDKFAELKKVMDKNGHIKMKLNEKVMIPRVALDLYKYPESSFRELYANSCRACRIAKTLGSENPYIKISLNTKTRKLIVHDVNSQGITQKVFAQILIRLGDSTNFDPTEIGQNGMGIASYGLLGETMKLETKCIETDDCYAMLGKSNDMGFDFLDETPNLENTGTRISITLKPKTNYSKLVRTLKTLASVSGVKTHFELECGKGLEIADLKSGLHTLPQTTYKDIFKSTIENDRSTSYLTSSLVNKDIEVHLSVGVDQSGSLTNTRKKEVYVINNPIECLLDEDDHDEYKETLEDDDDDDDDNNYLTNDDDDENEDVIDDSDIEKPEIEKEIYKRGRIDEIRFESVVINLKNERDEGFKPKPDRERLTTDAEEKIRKIVIDLYNQTLRKVKPCKELKEWFDHEHKYFISSTHSDVLELLDKRSKEINQFLNITIHELDPESPTKKKFKSKKLKEVLSQDDSKLFYLWNKDKRVTNLLDANYEDHFLCYLQSDKTTVTDENIKILHDFGFKEGKQYLKDHKIKAKRTLGVSQKTVGDLTLHYASYGDQTRRLNVNEESFNELVKAKHIVRVEPFDDYREFLKDFSNKNFYLTISKKDIEYLPTITDIEKEISNVEYLTNHGKLTYEQIRDLKIKDKKTIKFKNEFDISYYRFLDTLPKNTVFVFDDSEVDTAISKKVSIGYRTRKQYDINQINLLKLGLVLTFHGITFTGNSKDDMEQYYKTSVDKLAKSIKLQHSVSDYDFESVLDYENFLLIVKQVDEKLKDKTLRKMFENTLEVGRRRRRTKEYDYVEFCNEVIELQTRLGSVAKPILANPVGSINRPKPQYLE